MKEKNLINQEGLIDSGIQYNTQSDEFKALKTAILSYTAQQTPEEKVENKLISLKLKMEDYLNQQNPKKIVGTGQFLKEILKTLNIKNNTFAEYIGLTKSNFSALINGNRKLNLDLAITLGRIFNVKPEIWLNIENKNQLFQMMNKNKKKYEQYQLEDLISPHKL